MPRRTLLLLVIAALALVSPAPIRAWRLSDSRLERVPVPSALRVVRAQTSADFDRDGLPETLTLTEGHAVIATGDRTRWESPSAWQVQQAQITDLDRDGMPEAALLVWRSFQPWPVDRWLPNGGRIDAFHDSNGMACHLILIGWNRDALRELWAGSALAEPVDRFAAADLLGDGRQYLVTLQGEYGDAPSAPSRRLKVWEWNGFGFTLVHGLEASFRLLVPVQVEAGQVLLLTD
ncbi:MAG: hypothetical protein JW730_15415 [Anaerolineales bacterium]|nr:hypothetical protein [Anaerolineales bacterium]